MQMNLFKKCTENYVNWVIKLGKTKSAILGFVVLCIFAIIVQIFLDYLFLGRVLVHDILRSVLFGLISAPFVIYFFNVIVEKLEKSRVKLEQSIYELGTLREQDFILNKRLEKNSQDKTKLMATISHELRTPLNGIIGLSRILLEGELAPKQREYLKTINISAVSLGHIFSDIIDLEKIDSKRIELFNKPVEVIQLINDINHFANLMAGKKEIKFHLEYAKQLPHYINVDNARLSQVIWNLLSNAVKFTPEKGDVTLKINQLSPSCFQFIVIDSGIGIAKEEQDKIFNMFYQSERSDGNKAQGSGIGLAVSKHIAQLMGGDLTVESQLGRGSTFTLTIQAEATHAEQDIQVQNLGLKVLLVEDVEVNVIVAKAMLEKFGCEIDVAMSGAEAYRQFEQHSYDLILLDIQLPDTTGTLIAQELRRRYENEEIDYLPLMVALTANIMQTKSEYQSQGMDDVLRKPLSLEALANCLNEHFGEVFLLNKSEKQPLEGIIQLDEKIYNKPMLDELVNVLGKSGVQANLALFEKLMPEYIAELQHAFQQWKIDDSPEYRQILATQAHKMKGAFASVGLKRLQEIAQLAQTDNGTEWTEHIAFWVEQMVELWQFDLEGLQKIWAE